MTSIKQSRKHFLNRYIRFIDDVNKTLSGFMSNDIRWFLLRVKNLEYVCDFESPILKVKGSEVNYLEYSKWNISKMFRDTKIIAEGKLDSFN